MDPSRFVLTDRQWLVIEPLCPGGVAAPGCCTPQTGRMRSFLIRFFSRLSTMNRFL